MKPGIFALLTLVATIVLSAPATAQRVSLPRIRIIGNESQDFFKQGRQLFEREIRFVTLRTNFPNQDLLKIREFPPLEDGSFFFDLSDAFTCLTFQTR